MTKDHVLIWNNCLISIRQNINLKAYKTWFEPIKPIKVENQTLTIQVPNNFFFEWLEENYLDLLSKTVKNNLGANGTLEYQILVDNHKKIGQNNQVQKTSEKNAESSQKVNNPFAAATNNNLQIDSFLNPIYTFDDFIEGECNRFPRTAGQAISKKPGETGFNPLIIYGGVGLGKTHLAQAIGNEIIKLDPSKKVLYLTTEKFTNQVIHTIKTNTVNEFMSFYQFLDVLIIDDVQFLAGRPKTQEIFFNIFNQLHQQGKQLILTSDRAPKDIPEVEARLISRFKWGLVAELKMPDHETRLKILEYKLAKVNLKLSQDIKEYICYHVKNSIRELEGIVISLIAQSSLNNKKIDLKLVHETLEQFVDIGNNNLSMENITQLVATHLNVPIEKIQSKTRRREVVIARQISMYLIKTYTKTSLKEIGEIFGGRDHSTVIHSLKTVEDLIITDELFKTEVNTLISKVKSSLISV